ncbi:beta-defensin 118 [Onychomys torridus]|uniref:beta-defensin 118 n=1 Tax=Onychomys torridus TaxID=38674 RepID=UPI00167FB181|nr:beta-defensin 118 [Onychomys torridus]
MRLLLLALPALALLPQVIPAYSGEKICLNRSGNCRKNCKDGEMMRDTCKNHRVCCVPVSRGDTRMASVRVSWTTEETMKMEYDLNSEFTNVLSTVVDPEYKDVRDERTALRGGWRASDI